MNRETTDVLPTETLAHIQSAGCKAQKKSVIGAHKRCWKYLIGAISTHGEAARDLEFIGGDKDKQLEKLAWSSGAIPTLCKLPSPMRVIKSETTGSVSAQQALWVFLASSSCSCSDDPSFIVLTETKL